MVPEGTTYVLVIEGGKKNPCIQQAAGKVFWEWKLSQAGSGGKRRLKIGQTIVSPKIHFI